MKQKRGFKQSPFKPELMVIFQKDYKPDYGTVGTLTKG